LKSEHSYAILFLKSVNAEFLSAIFELRELLLELIGMAGCYKKHWKLLIDKDMKKKDLCAAAGISHASMAKLGKSENVTTDVLVKICTALQCDIGDIMELTQDPIK